MQTEKKLRFNKRNDKLSGSNAVRLYNKYEFFKINHNYYKEKILFVVV